MGQSIQPSLFMKYCGDELSVLLWRIVYRQTRQSDIFLTCFLPRYQFP